MAPTAMFLFNPEKQQRWEATLSAALASESWQLEKIATKQLVGILLLIYIKYDLVQHVKAVEAETVSTGNLGLGNKGAVGCHLRLVWISSDQALL